jgi:L-iditol 2-dehydrogenase
VAQWIAEQTGGRGVEATFEASGSQDGLTAACLCARAGGRAILIGSPATDELSIPMHECRRKELLMQHSRRTNGELHAAIDAVASGRIAVRPFATHFFSLDQTAQAFDLVQSYADGVIRAIVLPNGPIEGEPLGGEIGNTS